jgi:hypothetical protein
VNAVLTTLTIAIVVLINVMAIRRSRLGASKVHVVARYAGIAGLVSLVVAALAVFDLITQIWVARPGYSGWQVKLAITVLVLTTVISLVTLLFLFVKGGHQGQRPDTDR